MGSRAPVTAVAIAAMVLVPGCGSSGQTHKTTKRHTIQHTFYGVDPESRLRQREILSWTSQDDDGPINGTYTLQEKATASAPWTTSGQPESFQGTQHGNEIVVPTGQTGHTAGLHGTIQQNGHRLHLDSDLGIQTYDLYDSMPALPTPPTSQPPDFSGAEWFSTHPITVSGSIVEIGLRATAIVVTGTTGPDWGNREYVGGLDRGWFLVYRRAAVSAGRVRAVASDCTMPVQGHPDYCMGAEAYQISLSPGQDPVGEGIYQATKVTLFDQNSSKIDISSGRVPAGQKFRVVLQSRMLQYRRDTFSPGDIAVVWLDPTKRDETISDIKEFPVDAFLPVTS